MFYRPDSTIRETSIMEGYIYVLTTPATSLLKIGKTSRDPKLRAQELSSGTGVPFPFEVAYSVLVNDCTTLEHCVHARLANRRASTKREFFDVSLEEAVNCIHEFLIVEPLDIQTEQDASIKAQNGCKPEIERALQINSERKLILNAKELSGDAPFDALAYARMRMIEVAKARILLFKKIFKKSADVYQIVSKLEGQPLQSEKRYPPFGFHLTDDKSTIYISFLFFTSGWVQYGTGNGQSSGGISEYKLGVKTQEIAEEIISDAAPAFLERNPKKGNDYDPDSEYCALDYRCSLPKDPALDSIFTDIKPDIINYLEGYADLDYLAAKYLDLPYPFVQPTATKTEQLEEEKYGYAAPSSSPVPRIKRLLSQLRLLPKRV